MPSSEPLSLLCAGAAKGLVLALQAPFFAATGARIDARFGAVGAMKDALLSSATSATSVNRASPHASCDVFLATQNMVDALCGSGHLNASQRNDLGCVRTGIAVKRGESTPDVSSPAALKAALLAASQIYFPDPERATAGIHFAKVVRELGIYDDISARFKTYPNGATAMAAMALADEHNAIGCTQVTEINYTEGVTLVAVLPAEFELATVYTAAVCTGSLQSGLAAQWVALLGGAESAALRVAGGFEI